MTNLDSFEEVYAKTDWSRFKNLPDVDQSNRANACGAYLPMEQEARKQ